MVTKHTTKNGKVVWKCDTCKKRRKTEGAASAHQLTCNGRPKDKVNDYTNANLATKTKHKPGLGYKCCVCLKRYRSVKVIGNHHICRSCFKTESAKNDGILILSDKDTVF